MKETVFTAPDIVCGGCASSIEKALGKMKGVRRIEVDVERKNVRVSHEETLSSQQIAEKLDDIGFPVG